MRRSTFTILIGTKGRDTLQNTLESVARQRRILGDTCLVGIDALDMSQNHIDAIINLVRSYGDGFYAAPHVGIDDDGRPYHWLGVAQINYMMQNFPMGDRLFTLGDDDAFVDDAYDILGPYCDADPLRPILYKFKAPNGWLLWDRPRFKPCLISGCCIAAPRQLSALMHTRLETTHDFDWMDDILKKAELVNRQPLWLDWVGVIARPDRRNNRLVHAGVWQCRLCPAWRYLEDGALTQAYCPQCRLPSDSNGHLPRVAEPCEVDAPNAYTTVVMR